MQAVSPAPDGCYPGLTTAEGCNALSALTSGVGNTGLGWDALFGTSTANFNTGVGAGALVLNNADSNTAVGAAALLLNTAGTENSALGTAAMVNNDNGTNNTAVGAFALQTNTNGSNNTAVGNAALQNSTGDFNNAVGAGAGTDPGIGSNNVYIGDPGFPGDTNVISIGGIPASGTAYTATFIGGIYGASVNSGTALPVYVDTDGHLGTPTTSSARFKEAIKPMDKASEAILALQPVTFRYKHDLDPNGIPQFGLVAEEVEKVNPDLVIRNDQGKPYTVRYEAVNAMLLNEFLKEHRKVQDLEANVLRQQKQ